MSSLKKTLEWLKTEEGQESIRRFWEEKRMRESVVDKQLERFHNRDNFVEFVAKVVEKYDSKEYKDRWYSRGIEPPEQLFWFLYTYAEKYGRECSETEWEEYGNMFTSGLFYINGYYFNRMDGQGSVMKVIKENV